MSPLDRHERAILQFSGGKDSLACLHLLKPHWDKLTVMWVNTGAAFPETVEQMEELARSVRFVEVKSDQPAQTRTFGPPADCVPVRASPFGRWAMQSDEPPIQSALECCHANLWAPMAKAVKESGISLVIRGQRSGDIDKSPIRSGSVVDGIEYWFPIDDWTEQRVRNYLMDLGVSLPAHYAYVNSSLDCWSCTAYRDHVVGRMAYMKEKHPDLHAQMLPQLTRIRDGVAKEMVYVERALNG